MEKSIFNRKLLLTVLTIFVFVFAIQVSEPASAAKTKLVKSGVKYIHSTDDLNLKYSWKIYKQGKTKAILKSSLYCYETGKKVYMKLTFTKISKKYLKIKFYTNGKLSKTIKAKYVTSAYNYAKLFNSFLIKQFENGGSI